jgi:hypothetical protein
MLQRIDQDPSLESVREVYEQDLAKPELDIITIAGLKCVGVPIFTPESVNAFVRSKAHAIQQDVQSFASSRTQKSITICCAFVNTRALHFSPQTCLIPPNGLLVRILQIPKLGTALPFTPSNSFTITCRRTTIAQNGLHLWLMMLLRLTLLHKAATTTVIAIFPFLRLTFSLLCVFGRKRTMAKLLLVRRYLTSTTSGHKAHHVNVDAA